MDKRSLIAILVTFGILIAWQMIYVRPKQQEAARARTEQAWADSIAAAEAAEVAVDEPEVPANIQRAEARVEQLRKELFAIDERIERLTDVVSALGRQVESLAERIEPPVAAGSNAATPDTKSTVADEN